MACVKNIGFERQRQWETYQPLFTNSKHPVVKCPTINSFFVSRLLRRLKYFNVGQLLFFK